MARDLLDHMIEEADPGRDRIKPAAVEIDRDLDRRFGGVAADRGGTHKQPYRERRRRRNRAHMHLTLATPAFR